MNFSSDYLEALSDEALDEHYGWAHAAAQWHSHAGRHALAAAYDRMASRALSVALERQVDAWVDAADQAYQLRLVPPLPQPYGDNA